MDTLRKKIDEFFRKPSLLRSISAPILLGLLVVVVDALGPAFRAPYWLDEAWVALSTRYPLAHLPTVTASTPIGFSLLLRIVPGANNLRIIPLIFLILTVICGYLFGTVVYRQSDNRLAIGTGFLIAIFLIFAPFLVGAPELKQYTADAFTAVLILILCAKLDTDFSAKKVCWLSLAILVCMTISHTVVFVGVAALIAVIMSRLMKKAAQREILFYCGIFIVSLGAYFAYYLLVDRRGRTSGVLHYWASFFPTAQRLPAYLSKRLKYLVPFHNVGVLLVLLVLFGLGIAKLFQLRKKITGLTILAIIPIVIFAGLAKVYPLLDERTSIYLLTITTITIALGFEYVVELSNHIQKQYVPVLLCACALSSLMVYGIFAEANYALEDTRNTSHYVSDHFKQGDIILVTTGASYGFAFYWPTQPGLCKTASNAVGFFPCYPGQPLVIMPPPGSGQQLKQLAASNVRKLHKGSSVWLVASHISYSEALVINAWIKAGDLAYYKGNAEVIRLHE